jgi:hypothetical protein
MGGGHETIDTAALRALAAKFDSDVGRHVDEARTLLGAATSIEYSNFTAVTWPLASAYVEATNFQLRDLETKRSTVNSYGVALAKTADDWDAAEHASTVETDGN